MRESAVLTWIMDECETVLANSSLVSISTPSDHVDVAEPGMDHPYPFVGVQKIAANPQSAGIGSADVFVESVKDTDNDGYVDEITKRRDIDLRVSVIPVTDNDAKLRDDLGGELSDHFAVIGREGASNDDIGEIETDEASPQGRPDDLIRADGIPLEIEYSRYIVDSSVTAAETVTVDLDVGDQDEDVSESSDADAIDGSVS